MAVTKNWWKNGIIYQIYPRSFQDSNNDGIGDLIGIIKRLDYLKDLGVDGIWLSPINPSPDVDFGYDVSNYFDIDKKFGSLSDFEMLIDEAHEHDIHIILDLVLNHTSDQHPWFEESRKSKENPYHDWYLWRDPSADGGPPNNWSSSFGGSGWEYDKTLKQYYFHMFYPEQPDINWRNAEVRQTMLGIFKYWLDRGVDGFRLDVFNTYYKHPNFKDNPRKKGLSLRSFENFEHLFDSSQPEMIPLLQDIRKLVDEYPERYIVGETFLVDAKKAREYIGDTLLHAGFDYTYANTIWGFLSFLNLLRDWGQLSKDKDWLNHALERHGAESFRNTIRSWEILHGEDAWPNYFLNNHDTPRSSVRYSAESSDTKLKLLACLHLTLRGTPFLYYGEEIGMRDIRVSRNEIQDPVGKRYWPFYKGRDGCRSPMQWDSSTNAGFSSNVPWLKVNPDFTTRNVNLQNPEPSSLLNFYKELIKVRKQYPALHAGSIKFLFEEQQDVLVFQRVYEDQSMIVILNFLNQSQIQSLPIDAVFGAPCRMIFNGNEPDASYIVGNSVFLPPFGMAILLV